MGVVRSNEKHVIFHQMIHNNLRVLSSSIFLFLSLFLFSLIFTAFHYINLSGAFAHFSSFSPHYSNIATANTSATGLLAPYIVTAMCSLDIFPTSLFSFSSPLILTITFCLWSRSVFNPYNAHFIFNAQQVIRAERSDRWTLQIKFPQLRDAGIYECQVNTEPKMSMAFRLNIVGEY